MMKQLTILLFTTLIWIAACQPRKVENQTVYNIEGGWDWVSTALPKGYKAEKVNPSMEESNWSVSFQKHLGAVDVRAVCFDSAYLLLRCGNKTLVNHQYAPQAWWIVDTRVEGVEIFTNRTQFESRTKAIGFGDIAWVNLDSLERAGTRK